MDVIISFLIGLIMGGSFGMIVACIIMSAKDDTLES